QHMGVLALAGILTLAAAASSGQTPAEGKTGKFWVFVGTYTSKGGSKGIYRLELDLATGKLSNPELAAETGSPSFLAIHPNRRFLYSVGEGEQVGPNKAGGIHAFALDVKTGQLKPLNRQSSGGPGPCHLVVDHDGRCVLAANYGGGSVCCLPIR